MGKIQGVANLKTQGNTMSKPDTHHPATPADVVEEVVPYMPIVLPLVGGVLMFLLAFIAISMA
jgi:hypothetical protein